MTDRNSPAKLDLKKLTITSFVFGFFLVPVHELGHVICDWVTGHPAGMSYARDYLLSAGEPSFLGVLGGPSLPIIMAATAVVFIYRRRNLSLFYPIAIQASVERLVPYICGMLPSDERDLAKLAGWNMYSFNHIFLSLELLLLGLIVISFFKHKVGIKQSVLIFAIALTCLVASAAIGILVVERCVSKAVQNTIWVIMTKPPPRFSAQRPGGSSLLFETLDELCRMGSAYEKPPR